MNEIYCLNCKYIKKRKIIMDDGYVYYCKKNKFIEKNFLKKEYFYKECKEINKNNDCKDFEEVNKYNEYKKNEQKENIFKNIIFFLNRDL